MRYALLTAALLAFAAATPNAALAFDVDTSGNTNPDGSTRYVDPDENPQFGGTGTGTGNITVGPNVQFGSGVVSGYSSSSQSSSGPVDQPWQAPRMRAGH